MRFTILTKSERCVKSFGESAEMCLPKRTSRSERSYWIKECHRYFRDLFGVTNLVPELLNGPMSFCLYMDNGSLLTFHVQVE